MKCQYCHEHEAVNSFLISYPGGEQEVHLCEECTKMAQRYYAMARHTAPGLFLNDSSVPAVARKVGSVPFPEDAGTDIQRRRQMNMLKAQLELAIQDERYEEAARLRDQIAAEEKDVCVR